MRRLPRVALVTTAVILLLCALVLSGLRFLLPNIDNYRQDLIDYVEKKTDVSVQIGKLKEAAIFWPCTDVVRCRFTE